MTPSLDNPVIWLVAAVFLTGAGVLTGLRIARLQQRAAARPAPSEPDQSVDDRTTLRSASLDALAEAVLITDQDGRVLDCNSSALTLFDRHRGAVEDQYATTLRRFDGLGDDDPHRIASEHAVWVGEGWARQPDGAMKLCHVRVIALRDERARITAFAESFRDVTLDRDIEAEFRDLLYGVRAFDVASHTSGESLTAVREELRVLSEAFRDLEHVLRQYERLLPSLSADDPLSEAIAGAASDARAAVSAVGVPALLEEIPRALSRLRGHLQVLSAELQTRKLDAMDLAAPIGQNRPTGARHNP